MTNFRGKRKDNDEWVFGGYYLSDRYDYEADEFPCYIIHTHDIMGFIGIRVRSETVGQLVNFFIDGKMLYGGDILERPYQEKVTDPIVTQRGYVAASNDGTQYVIRTKDRDYPFSQWITRHMRYIGNIYDNAEAAKEFFEESEDGAI